MTNFELFNDIGRVYDYAHFNKHQFLLIHKEVTEQDYTSMQQYVRTRYGGLLEYGYYAHMFDLMREEHELALRCAIDSLNDEDVTTYLYGQMEYVGYYRNILKTIHPSYIINWASKNLEFYFAQDDKMNYKDAIALAKKLLFEYVLPQYEDEGVNRCWEKLTEDGIASEDLEALGLYYIEMAKYED